MGCELVYIWSLARAWISSFLKHLEPGVRDRGVGNGTVSEWQQMAFVGSRGQTAQRVAGA